MATEAKNCVNTYEGKISHIQLVDAAAPYTATTTVSAVADKTNGYAWDGTAIYKSAEKLVLRLKTTKGTKGVRPADSGELTITIVYRKGDKPTDVPVKDVNYVDDVEK